MAYTEIDNIFIAHYYKWMRLPGLEVTSLELQLFWEGALRAEGTISQLTLIPFIV